MFQSSPADDDGWNYWLENEHIATVRLLHLLAVTFLLFSFSFPFYECVFVRWHWWDKTQICCQNKQEIYQSLEKSSYLPATSDKCKIKIRRVH